MNHRKTYKTRNVVRLTGVSADLLRAWEFRHHLLQPERTSGGHRLYTEDDLRVLRRIRVRMDDGQTIGEIAQVTRGQLLAEDLVAASRPEEGGPAPPAPAPGSVVVEDRLEILRTAFIKASLALDGPALERACAEAFAVYSPDVVIHQIMELVANSIGELWAEGRCNVAAEHFFSQFVSHKLRKLIELHMGDANTRKVVCACLPDEEHELGLLAVAYQLVRQGNPLIYLGPGVPLPALEWACEVTQPRAVFLSVSQPGTFRKVRRRLLQVLERRAKQTEFYLGGRGVGVRVEAFVEAGAHVWPLRKPLTELSSAITQDQFDNAE